MSDQAAGKRASGGSAVGKRAGGRSAAGERASGGPAAGERTSGGPAAGERAAGRQPTAEPTTGRQVSRPQTGGSAMGTRADEAQDSVDQHVARWSAFWKDEPSFTPEIEGALVRMHYLQREARRADAAAFAQSKELTFEDYKTLHVLMVQPWPTEATPAQLAEAANVTRAAMTSRLDRLAESGLITRQVDGADRRRVLVRPTAEGREMWNKYIFKGIAIDQQALGGLDHAELTQLNGLLRKILLALGE